MRARRIRHQAAGKPVKPFRYHDLGSAAYISRGRAVVSAGRLHLGGFIGWIVWLFIHIAFLTGFRNRFGAILTWWVAFTRDTRRERAFTTHQIGLVTDVYAIPPPTPGHGRATRRYAGRWRSPGRCGDRRCAGCAAIPGG